MLCGMEIGPALERMKTLATLSGAGLHGELAASLLARVGTAAYREQPAGAEEFKEPDRPVPRTPAELDAVYRFDSCPYGQTLPRMLDLFAGDPGPHTTLEITEATGANLDSVRNLLRVSGRFECVAYRPGRGEQKSWVMKRLTLD